MITAVGVLLSAIGMFFLGMFLNIHAIRTNDIPNRIFAHFLAFMSGYIGFNAILAIISLL